MMLYKAILNMIRAGRKSGLNEKIEFFRLHDKITQEQYETLKKYISK